MDDNAANARARRGVRRLDIVVIGADIADMGEGEGDDLPGIGWIGEDFLIAGHGRIEADLAHGLARGAKPGPLQNEAVGENEKRAHAGLPPETRRFFLILRHARSTPMRSPPCGGRLTLVKAYLGLWTARS